MPSATLLHQRMLESFKSKQEIMFHASDDLSVCAKENVRFRHIKNWPLHCLHPILTVVLSHVLLKVHVPVDAER